MRGYDFHPEARADLNEIWAYIAQDNPDAADRVIDNIEAALEALSPFLIRATNARTLPEGLYALSSCANT